MGSEEILQRISAKALVRKLCHLHGWHHHRSWGTLSLHLAKVEDRGFKKQLETTRRQYVLSIFP